MGLYSRTDMCQQHVYAVKPLTYIKGLQLAKVKSHHTSCLIHQCLTCSTWECYITEKHKEERPNQKLRLDV